MFNWLKTTAGKADEVLDQTKKDVSETSQKIQKVLDNSGKDVKVILSIIGVTFGVSILANLINIGLNISKHGYNKNPTVVIHNLYLKGDKRV